MMLLRLIYSQTYAHPKLPKKTDKVLLLLLPNIWVLCCNVGYVKQRLPVLVNLGLAAALSDDQALSCAIDQLSIYSH